jgi:hypothetical protein
MTEQEAIDLAATRWYDHATDYEIAAFQLSERRLCCPFTVFHKAVERAVDRPVWSHELLMREGCEQLLAELDGADPLTFEQVCALVPNAIVIGIPPKEPPKPSEP